MCGHADRAHAGAAAAVRDAECLVQVEMANVRTDIAGTAKGDLRIEVGAVHVDLSAGGMHQITNFTDAFLKDPVRGRIGDHEGGELRSVLRDFLTKVRHIDIAVRVAAYRHDGHSGHDRAGRVGPVGGGGNETNIAPGVATREVVGANDEQSGVLALGAGVGLQGDGGKAGDFREPRIELAKEFAIALGLVDRSERMQVAKFRPGNRDHFRRGVELHGA